MIIDLQVITHLEMAKSPCFVLLQISYPYIVWNNFQSFKETVRVVFEICAQVCT